MLYWCKYSLLLGLCLVAFGCGPKGLDVQSVTGTVTLDAKPLDGVTITFAPVQSGAMGFATTDATGTYRISALGGKPEAGTTLGTYRVSFDKTVSEGPQPTKEELADPNFVPGSKYNIDKVKQLVPKKYLDPSTSGIEVTVQQGTNRFDFALTSK